MCSTDNFLSSIFSSYLKFVAGYITGQWDKFRVNNATLYLHIHFCHFIKKYVFLWFSLPFLMKCQFTQHNMNQSETRIEKVLSVKLCEKALKMRVPRTEMKGPLPQFLPTHIKAIHFSAFAITGIETEAPKTINIHHVSKIFESVSCLWLIS